MTANDSPEPPHTVSPPRMSRRTRYDSTRYSPLPARGRGPGRGGRPTARLRLVVEGGRVRRAGRARVLRVRLARRDVAQLVGHDAHTHGGGRHPDGADAELLVHQDLPDVLRDLVAVLRLL